MSPMRLVPAEGTPVPTCVSFDGDDLFLPTRPHPPPGRKGSSTASLGTEQVVDL